MASTQTPPGAPRGADDQNSAIAGLDSLELAEFTKDRRAGQDRAEELDGDLAEAARDRARPGAWQLFYLSNFHGDASSGLVKGPGAGLANLWDQLQHGQLWECHREHRCRRRSLGYALAMLIGSVIGAVVSRIPPLRAATGSIISGLQTMPSIAWFPFAIILFGTTESAILFVMVLGAAPSIANGLITGVDYTPPLLLRAGRTMGLRGVALYRYLILPASLPAYRGRYEAGLGVRLAQPDGRRAAGHHRRQPLAGHPAEQRAGPART